MEPAVQSALYGAYATGFLVAAAFFLRFWVRTREPLLVIFSAAFAVLALSYGFIGITQVPTEQQTGAYVMRLAAFVLIIVGIVWTNIRGRKP